MSTQEVIPLSTLPGNLKNTIRHMRANREAEEELAKNNPFLMEALQREKYEGQRIATYARTIALGIIAVFLPFLNPEWGVLFYEAFIVAFILIGWLQLRVAQVGQSGIELALILFDLLLLTFVCLVPYPFVSHPVPAAFAYNFNTFIYFFVLLATGALAYSWRTIWSMGLWVSVLWLGGLGIILLFGNTIPAISEMLLVVVPDYPRLYDEIDPNNAHPAKRFQEVVVFSLVAFIIAIKGMRSNRLLMQQASLAEERANLSRYFPPNMVDELATQKHDAGAVRSQEIAVLFADVRGFTAISENNPPEQVMKWLRNYHSILENAIFRNGGTLDKFIGDGIMATFGTPNAGPDDSINAVRAAQQIMKDMEISNRDSEKRGEPPFPVSVGVHFGPVIMGDIGPDRRLEFAVIGDTVNVASRLETASREYDCGIILSDALVSRLGDKPPLLEGFRKRKGVSLKGRKSKIDVWCG